MLGIPIPASASVSGDHSFEWSKVAQTYRPPVTIFNIMNPGEPAKSLIVFGPDVWGPFFTCEELQTAHDELKADGLIP